MKVMSLRSRFTAALLVTAAAGILLASGIILYASNRELLAKGRESLRLSCEIVLEAHTSFLEENGRLVERIAASPSFAELFDATGIARRIALKAAEAEVVGILATAEGIASLAIEDEGGLVLSLPEGEAGPEAGTRLVRRADGRWRIAIECPVPGSPGKVRALVDLDAFGRGGMLSLLAGGGVAAFIAQPSSGEILWTNARGTAPEAAGIPAGGGGGADPVFLEYERGGGRRIACRIERGGYAYLAEISREELFADLGSFTRLAAAVALVLLAAGVVTSILISRRLTGAIRSLAEAARRISRKDYRVELDIHSGDEMETLYVAFKEMGGEIARFTADLEGIVAARTAELSERMAEIERLMVTDSLTGIANRRKGTEALETEVARSSRYGNRLCLVLFDVDHFKAVNDRHGHGMGDRVLAGVAGAAVAVLRPVDLAARWGGEEFLVILPETEIEGGMAAAEKIRRAVGGLRFEGGLAVTVSAGVAAYRPDESADGLVERADAAMYQAKSQGRDRVVRAAEGRET